MSEGMPGRLLTCPICATHGVKQILGKVLDNGDLIVLRFHHGTTIITAKTYNIVCGCGQIFNVDGTVLTETYVQI